MIVHMQSAVVQLGRCYLPIIPEFSVEAHLPN